MASRQRLSHELHPPGQLIDEFANDVGHDRVVTQLRLKRLGQAMGFAGGLRTRGRRALAGAIQRPFGQISLDDICKLLYVTYAVGRPAIFAR